MDDLPFMPLDQLKRLVNSALLQGLKQGPGSQPMDPTIYQQYIQTQELNNIFNKIPPNQF